MSDGGTLPALGAVDGGELSASPAPRDTSHDVDPGGTCAICRTSDVRGGYTLGCRIWACTPCLLELREYLAADVARYVRAVRPIVTNVARLCPRCEGESDPEMWTLLAGYWAAQRLGVRLRFEPPDPLRAEYERAMMDVLEAVADPIEDLLRNERALQLAGHMRARVEIEEALRLVTDLDSARDVHRALGRARRHLRAGRICDDGKRPACARRARVSLGPTRPAICDPGPRIWQRQAPSVLF